MTIDSAAAPDLLPAPGRHPYYVIAPRYTSSSAGVRALHLITHWLNRTGQSAFLWILPLADGLQVDPELLTPVLTEAIARRHFETGSTPIVVYPETLDGDPLKAPVRVRWFGNYPGLLGGASRPDPDELWVAHSGTLAEAVGPGTRVLHTPTVDTRIFHPEPSIARKGVCFYAAKYKEDFGGETFGLPQGAFEITRNRPDSLSQVEIADLFRRSELFYCFEDSALMNEAALCGCPVVMMPNPFFSRPLAMAEVGWDGYARDDSPDEIARARATVHLASTNYRRAVLAFFEQLDSFTAATQAAAAAAPYADQVVLQDRTAPLMAELQRLASNGRPLVWSAAAALAGARLAVEMSTGWSYLEEGGIWSLGRTSVLTVRPPEGVSRLTIEFVAYAPPGGTRTISFGIGNAASHFQLGAFESASASVDLTGQAEPFEVAIRCDKVHSPASASESRDRRPLGVYVHRVWAEHG